MKIAAPNNEIHAATTIIASTIHRINRKKRHMEKQFMCECVRCNVPKGMNTELGMKKAATMRPRRKRNLRPHKPS
jgi:hypothetical protein